MIIILKTIISRVLTFLGFQSKQNVDPVKTIAKKKLKEAKKYAKMIKEKREHQLKAIKPRPSKNQIKRCSKGLHVYGLFNGYGIQKGKCIYCGAEKKQVQKKSKWLKLSKS